MGMGININMQHVLVHAAFPRPCCMNMFMPHVYVHFAPPCPVNAAFHVHAGCPCPCCVCTLIRLFQGVLSLHHFIDLFWEEEQLFTHFHAVCCMSKSMLQVSPCLWCMSMSTLHFHVFLSMLHAHVHSHAASPYSCCISMSTLHVACSCPCCTVCPCSR
jgi:hypothetical protein